jgi:Flp pilus assembly protein TadG
LSGRRRFVWDVGQATVELALVLPVVVVLMLVVVQVGNVVYHRVLVVHVAREVVRAASVSPLAPDAATVAARHGLDASRLEVDVGVPDPSGFVRAGVSYGVPTDVAVVGSLLPDVTVSAEAHMSVEWTRRESSLKPRRGRRRRW